MGSRGMFFGMFPVVVLALVGCQRGEQDQTVLPQDQPPIAGSQAPTQELTPAPEEQLVSGELTQVDLEARTLTVRAADAEHVFTFSDVTAVTGTAGTQGLAGREGTRVNVLYREEQGTKMAVSIDVVEEQPSASPR